jgi:hypothetical protein
MLRFFICLFFLIIFAGTPATTMFFGTSLVTTAPAAITAFSPTNYAWTNSSSSTNPGIFLNKYWL